MLMDKGGVFNLNPGLHPISPHGKNFGSVLKKVGKAVLFFLMFAVAVPLVLGLVYGVPLRKILSFIGTTLVLHAWASPVGLALGLGTIGIIIIMACFALGISIAIFEICDSLALSSEWVRKRIEKMEKITEKYPQIKRFGPAACSFTVWIPGIGLYGTPVIAWILRWKRAPSIVFTVIGFLIATLIVLSAANQLAFG